MKKFDQSYYQELSAEVLTRAKQQGATGAEVTISIEAGFSVSSRLGQLETVEHHQDNGLGITVYVGQQTGSASTTDLSVPAIELTIEKACNIAKFTSSDPYAGLADPALMAYDYPDLELDHPWEITPEIAANYAIECETLAMDDLQITNSEGASVNSHRHLQLYANTHGFIGSYLTTQHSLNCILIAQQGGQMQRDFEYTLAREAEKLTKIEVLAKQARDKTVRRLGARRLKTRQSPVIFSPEVAKGLLGNFIAAISGSNIYRKSSFLLDHLESPVFPEHINITQKPDIKRALGSAPFDNEGVRTIEQSFVENGILKKYILNSYSARKLGMSSTGNAGGIFNVSITHSDSSLKDLLQKMDTGLLVTELIGQGVNIVTGDYSRGAFGYWVEKGEIVYPVEEITIAGNLKDMFLNIIDVANDVDIRGRILTGSILINKMTIAGE